MSKWGLCLLPLLLSSCAVHTLSVTDTPQSAVQWQTYTDTKLGVALDYPTASAQIGSTCKELIPVHIATTEQQIIVSQDYALDSHSCEHLPAPKLDTTSGAGHFIVNYGLAKSHGEMEKFIQHIYGHGCKLAADNVSILTDNKMPDESTCPGIWGGKVRLQYNPKTNTLFTWKSVEPTFFDPNNVYDTGALASDDTHSTSADRIETSIRFL